MDKVQCEWGERSSEWGRWKGQQEQDDAYLGGQGGNFFFYLLKKFIEMFYSSE